MFRFVWLIVCCLFFFFQAEDGIRDLVRSRGLGDVYKRQGKAQPLDGVCGLYRTRGKKEAVLRVTGRDVEEMDLSLIHI